MTGCYVPTTSTLTIVLHAVLTLKELLSWSQKVPAILYIIVWCDLSNYKYACVRSVCIYKMNIGFRIYLENGEKWEHLSISLSICQSEMKQGSLKWCSNQTWTFHCAKFCFSTWRLRIQKNQLSFQKLSGWLIQQHCPASTGWCRAWGGAGEEVNCKSLRRKERREVRGN